MHSFLSMGLHPEIARALVSFGFSKPTEIQSLSAQAILDGKDAYISSATGSGKTFAYLAPILSSIDPEDNQVAALILAPTHDLAAQLFRETRKLIDASGLPFRATQALGSIPLQRQKDQLKTKPQIIIGSAGRLRDLVDGRFLDIRNCKYLVMDEGDRLFEKEVIDISTDLLKRLPDSCSRIMVSATIADKIVNKTASWFRSPEKLFLDSTTALRSSIEHWCFHAPSRKKIDFLRRFEVAVKPTRCLLFVSSNAMLHNVAEKLTHFGIEAAVLKSTQAGNERKSAVNCFAEGEVRWLLTTDLGARGLDIPDISHVISFDLPEEPSIYVHRAGRTGRADHHGISVALTDLVELKRASNIAVRYQFPFICKILDSGHVHDIEPENFFALAEEAESQKQQPAHNHKPPVKDQQRRGQYSRESNRTDTRHQPRQGDYMDRNAGRQTGSNSNRTISGTADPGGAMRTRPRSDSANTVGSGKDSPRDNKRRSMPARKNPSQNRSKTPGSVTTPAANTDKPNDSASGSRASTSTRKTGNTSPRSRQKRPAPPQGS